MAEETKSSSGKSAKRAAPRSGGKVESGGLLPVQGEYLPRSDDPARVPGTREHLGDDPVYAGGPSPFVEGEA